jgi:hypothetical protein
MQLLIDFQHCSRVDDSKRMIQQRLQLHIECWVMYTYKGTMRRHHKNAASGAPGPYSHCLWVAKLI